MANEIFRPLRVFGLISTEDGPTIRVPVACLGVNWLSLSWKDGQNGVLSGLEVHGDIIKMDLALRSMNQGEAKVVWDDLSFNFTLFNLWLSGLNIDEREALITDVLSWQEEAHNKVLQSEVGLKKVA